MGVLEYHTLTRIKSCPYCGSRNIVIDYSTGTLVCRDCGAVIDDTIVDYSPTIHHYGYNRRHRLVADKTISIVDENRVANNYSILRLHVKLYKKVSAGNIDSMKYLLTLRPSEVYAITGNKCLWNLMLKLNGSEKLVAVEVYRMLLSGEEPLQAVLEREFKVPRKRIKSIVRAVRTCLGVPDPHQLL
jgi:hypothetical protein